MNGRSGPGVSVLGSWILFCFEVVYIKHSKSNTSKFLRKNNGQRKGHPADSTPQYFPRPSLNVCLLISFENMLNLHLFLWPWSLQCALVGQFIIEPERANVFWNKLPCLKKKKKVPLFFYET